MDSLFDVKRMSQKKDFLSIVDYINLWLIMKSGHGANPVFFNKEKLGCPENPLSPHPLCPITSHFWLTPTPPSKWTSYVYHP